MLPTLSYLGKFWTIHTHIYSYVHTYTCTHIHKYIHTHILIVQSCYRSSDGWRFPITEQWKCKNCIYRIVLCISHVTTWPTYTAKCYATSDDQSLLNLNRRDTSDAPRFETDLSSDNQMWVPLQLWCPCLQRGQCVVIVDPHSSPILHKQPGLVHTVGKITNHHKIRILLELNCKLGFHYILITQYY